MRNFAVNKFKKAMKRLYKYTSMLLLLAAGIFASCDSDTHRAVILSGEWRGNFGMYYDYNYRGTVVTFDSYDTYIVFYPDYNYASHGWGKQVDYYDYGPYEYQYHRFLWTVEGGVVYLRYPHEPELDTSIADYRLSSNTFTGYFTNASSRFVLYKLSSFYTGMSTLATTITTTGPIGIAYITPSLVPPQTACPTQQYPCRGALFATATASPTAQTNDETIRCSRMCLS